MAAPARFWFSLSPTNPYVLGLTGPAGSAPSAPNLAMNPGQTASVYLWAQPQTYDAGLLANGFPEGDAYSATSNLFRQLVGLSLDVTAEGPARVESLKLDNPGATGQPFGNPTARFQTLVDSDHPQTVVVNSASVTYPLPVDGGLQGVLAYYPTPPVSVPNGTTDPLTPQTAGIGRGAGGPAWLLGAMEVGALATTGVAEFRLQVGRSGMAHVGEIVDDNLNDATPGTLHFATLATFGESTGPVYNTQDPLHRQRTRDGDSADLTLMVVAPLIGDYNADGVVDAADYTLNRDRLGTNVYLPNRVGTGPIGTADLAAWRVNYGRATVNQSVAVPEPAALGCLASLIIATATVWRVPKGAQTAITLIASCVSSAAIADNIQWDGSSGRQWTEVTNWTNPNGPNRVPNNGDVAVLGGSGAQNLDRINLSSGQFVNGVRFGNYGGELLVTDANHGSDKFIQVGPEGIRFNPSFTGPRAILDTRIVLREPQEWAHYSDNTTGLHVRSVNLDGKLLALRGEPGSSFVFNGSVDTSVGTPGVVELRGGGPTVRFNGETNFNSLNINSGVAIMNETASRGFGNIAVAGGADFAVTVAGANAFSTGVAGRTVILGGTGQGSTTEAEFQFLNSNSPEPGGSRTFWEGNVQIDGFGVLSTNNSPPEVVGQVSGFLTGGGTLLTRNSIALSNANPFAGLTRVRSGRLDVDNALALQKSTVQLADPDRGLISFSPALSSVTFGGLAGVRNLALQNRVGNPIELRIGNNSAWQTEPGFTGVLSGPGSLTKIGSGIQRLGGTEANTYSGWTTVNGGELWLAKSAGNSSNGFGSAVGDLAINPGTLVRLYDNSQIRDDAAVYLNSATLDMYLYTDTIGELTLNNATITGYGGSSLFGQPGSQLGRLGEGNRRIAVMGDSTLGGARLFADGTVPIDVAWGSQLNLTAAVIDFFASASLVKNGPGTLIMNGAAVNTYSGSTEVNGGTLVLDRVSDFATQVANEYGTAIGDLTINSGGIVRVQSFNQIKDSATVVVNGGGALEVIYGVTEAVRNLNLAGRLDFTFLGGDVPALNDEVVVLRASSLAGQFDAISSPNPSSIPSGLGLELVQSAGQQRIRIVPTSDNNLFQAASPTSNWSNPGSWSATAAPTWGSIISLDNLTATPQQRVEVTQNVFIHHLAVGDGGDEITLAIEGGSSLSSLKGVTVHGKGLIAAEGGALVTNTIDIESGGALLVNSGGSLYAGSKSASVVIGSAIDLPVVPASLQIDGAGSRAVAQGTVVVGTASAAELTISQGGRLESLGGEIGRDAGSNGVVSISGVASAWSVSNELFVGGSGGAAAGSGSITVALGGQLFVGQRLHLWEAGSLSVGDTAGSVTVGVGNPGVASGGLQVLPGGTLSGTGGVEGDVVSGGLLRPGNSPGILTITGDYTQLPTSSLEIEVGALTPGPGSPNIDAGHDQVRVGGVATLGGRYDFPIINGFVPQVNDEIVFLDTFDADGAGPLPRGSIVAGTGPSSGFAPGLFEADPNLAFRVIATPTDVRLRFVPKGSATFTDPNNASADWFVASGWNTGSVPTNEDETLVQGNLTGQAQVVNVGAASTAQVQQLRVRDDISPVTVSVGSGASLESTVGNVNVGARGTIELSGGEIATPSTQAVSLYESGMLTGSGTVVGNLEVGVEAGSSSAMLSPGLSAAGSLVGSVTIAGGYTHGAGGVLDIDITGNNNGANHDFVDVAGDLVIGTTDAMGVVTPGTVGKLQIDLSAVANPASLIGQEYVIAEAASIDGRFAEVEVMGAGNVWFRVQYPDSAPAAATEGEVANLALSQELTGTILPKGKIIGEGPIDANDAAVFAAVLIGGVQELQVNLPELGLFPTESNETRGAFDFVNVSLGGSSRSEVDFNDVPYFAAAMAQSQGISYAQAMSTFERVYAEVYLASVPEPATPLLALMAAGGMAGVRWRRRTL